MKATKESILKTLSILLFMMLGLTGYNSFSQNTIRVEEGKIYTSCNEEVVMRGVNEMFVWSQDRTGTTILPEIAKTGSNAVRLVWTTQGDETELDQLINNSIKNKMIPVAELHDATGDFSKLQMLLDYWTRPAVLSTIQKYKKWLIVNIGNEVGNGSESTAQWVAYYKDAITQLRNAGIDTPLMIDCGGYGNRESYFLEGGNELLEFDPLHNIIFAVHTYWTNGDDQAKIDRLNTMIEDAKLKKLPYIIGEGPQEAASPIACGQPFPYQEMIKRLQEEKIGWLSWSWGAVDNSDCGAPNSVFDITSNGNYGSWASTFAEEICVTDINSIKNTSIIPQSMIDPTITSCGTTYTISASANPGGTISPSGNIIVSENDNQIFDITANIGFKIEDVLVDGSSIGDVNTYTFSNVTQNHTIEVIYATVPLPPQEPYVNGVPQVIPGKIKATSFDLGGETVAYHDISLGNDGNGIRQDEDVDTETNGDGGNIGYTAKGEWIEYTVNVAQAGIYNIEVLVASENSNGQFHIEFDGTDVTGIQNVAATSSWASFVPQKISNVTLTKGEQVMRFFIDNGAFNFSTMTFSDDGTIENNFPLADFITDKVTGLAPLEVSFDASNSSDPKGNPLTYNWDFGDGNIANGQKVTHTFDTIGEYTVTLTVDNGQGGTDTKTITIKVVDQLPTSDIILTYKDGGNGSATDNTINPHIQLINNGDNPIDYKDIIIRYWFTSEDSNDLNFWCDWAQLGTNDVLGVFGQNAGMNYLDISFTANAGLLPAKTNSGPIQVRFAKANWSNFDETDDYSYDNTKTAYTNHDKIAVYVNGNLVWGVEPSTTLSNISNPIQIKAFPNPVFDKLTLNTTTNFKNANIKVIDLYGNLLYEETIQKNTNIKNMDFSQLKSGIYFIQVKQDDDNIIVKQIIK